MSPGHSKPPPSLGAFQGPWDLGGYRGHVPAPVKGWIPSGDGRLSGRRQAHSQRPGVARHPRLVSQTPARPVFRYLPPSFHPFLPAESSRPAPQLGLDAGGWGTGEQAGWRIARLPSFPRAGFRAFPAPREVKSLQPHQLQGHPLDGPKES